GAYRLGSQNPQDNTTWGTGRVLLNQAIAPGQTRTITGNFVAPTTPGARSFSWMMLQEGVQWFPPTTCSRTITVSQPPATATCTISTSPAGPFEIGERFEVRATVHNSTASGGPTLSSATYGLYFTPAS